MLVPNNITVGDLAEIELLRKDVSEKDVEESFESLNFTYFSDFENPKSLIKFIKKVEKLIRGSYEYRKFVEAYKNVFSVENCAFFKNIKTGEKTASIELHHYPFTLYDITEIEIKKQSNLFTSKVNAMLIAEEVMRLHYNGLIGIIPLSKTVHQLAHSGEIFINLQLIKTDYQAYIIANSNFIDEELISKIKQIEKLSEGDVILSQEVLKRRVTMIEDKAVDMLSLE